MVCEKCKEAGQVRVSDPARSAVLHEVCAYGHTCTCQHAVEGANLGRRES